MPDDPVLVPGTTGGRTVCLLLKLGQVAFRITEDRLLALGLRIRHYSVLQALADLGGTPQAELGTYLRIDSATMVATIDDLEKLGYAARRRDPTDRRRYIVEVTEAGTAALGTIDEALAKAQQDVLGELSDARTGELHDALRTLNASTGLAARYDAVRGKQS
ncbi:winged helix-turn-helix transcriptional regulator [Nocardia puris]|uniref:DNA-binding MarR family transcriptional regulator n=1 Tax=Nocardia puris TaxID=208602 RepID=A0A366DJF2_9NOCA|nr:MarR family winged helix-turn-helix transcriptional regulator [Nocardia puris]MBF6212965.1 winged helix-turn-helix transcriptional regulator [Nocardia puris]MBF6367956.1 winged helix-turn-helix transcriptional regulator [Nocardia puris]MBF6462589.1 winged helix-turn-helix transcriptional regulator [Nocardia puris]RBO90212.1 DNA-binding MarR family transcriptional regulator [Nocardia puris]